MNHEVSRPLNSAERSTLKMCEATISKHIGTFVEVGTALAEINDGNLYRESHRTFEAYIKDKWDFAKSHAYRLIAAAEVVKNVPHGGQIPTSERQARPLVELPAERQAEAWEAAVEKAKQAGQEVTAAIVEEVVEQILEQTEPWKCPNCGGAERDEDGDCATCREPGEKDEPKRKEKSPTAADAAQAQVKIWADAVGRWLGQPTSIDDLRAKFPSKHGDRVVTLATELYEALKLWQKAIR